MKICLYLFFLFIPLLGFSQSERIQQISAQLELLVVEQPGLDETIETSVSQVSITEFVRGLGKSHDLNINVAEGMDTKLVNNFASARVADVLVFLCKEYDLEIEVIGTIISLRPYVPPVEEKPEQVYVPDVYFSEADSTLSLDLRGDSLSAVARQVTAVSGINVVLAPGIENRLINVFIQNQPFIEALEKTAFANNLQVRSDGAFVVLEPIVEATNGQRASSVQLPIKDFEAAAELSMAVKEGLISVVSTRATMAQIIEEASRQMGNNYFIYALPQESISLYLEDATYEELLTFLFHGTEFSFVVENDVYLIGTRENGMVTTELVQLQNRTIENILVTGALNRGSSRRNTQNNNGVNTQQGSDRGGVQGGSIQSDLFGVGIDIQPFPELNAFVVTGSYPEVRRFKDFVFEIDQVVPVVMIEVLIVDVNKNRLLSAGVNAGLGENAGETTGEIIGPSGNQGLNLDLSTETINGLIGSFNGLGWVNLGSVSPNFYMSLQAMETDGLLRMRSTPKLSTLNSYPASLTIGRQEYYLETRTNVNSSAANNVVTTQQVWVPLEADLNIDITPVVSGDEQVTLDIIVTQSNFTERSGDNGPFGTVSREFDSSIRVKNGEMILLGGLEDKTISNSGGGLPLLARVPVLRWFFGSRTRSKDETRLNIFIRPTILY